LSSEVAKAQNSWTWPLELAANRAMDRLAWARLPVVPKFRAVPVGFVPALAATWMTPAWYEYGFGGYNFWTMAMPEAPGAPSGRYDPDHRLFQAWVCVYVCRKIRFKRPLLQSADVSGPEAEDFRTLGRVDQKAWLWLKGADWAPTRVYAERENERARIGKIETRLVRSRMRTHADIGYDNPDPSPLRVNIRYPYSWPEGLTQGSFSPRVAQWKGKIRPYQEIEYTVHGFPIPVVGRGLSAFFFYAGAKYEREGRIVDNFDDVQAAVAPVLREGIEFVRNRRIGPPRVRTKPTFGEQDGRM
jgi:hypothetical protein